MSANPPVPASELDAIRARHHTARTLAETMPPIIEDWENGAGFLSGEEVNGLFQEVRMGAETKEMTFALHAWKDMGVLFAEVDRLRAQVADYENRTTWHTTCKECAGHLDREYAADHRAAQLRQAATSALEDLEGGKAGDAERTLLAALRGQEEADRA